MNRFFRVLMAAGLALGLAACGSSGDNGSATYTVSASIVGDASGSVAPGTTSVGAGQQASLAITLSPGASIESALGCGGRLSGRVFTTGPVSGDCVVTITLRQAGPQLEAFESTAALEAYLLAALDDDRNLSGPAAGIAPPPPSGDVAEGAPAFSQTNLQEAGVDEADRLKSDGIHLYTLHRESDRSLGGLRVLSLGDTAPPGVEEAGWLEFAESPLPETMYLLEDRLALLGSDFRGQIGLPMPVPLPGGWIGGGWHYPWAWLNGHTELTLVDISDRRDPTVTSRLTIDGHLVSSRRIGSRLHLVTRFTPGTREKLLPQWSLDDGESQALVSGEGCYRDPAGAATLTPDLITVTTVDLSGPAPVLSSQCIAGATEAIYVSLENLYLATTRYGYDFDAPTGDGADVAIRWSSPEPSTELHQFALTASGPSYLGSGSALGHLGWEQGKKSFRMGEYDGALRVVTSLGHPWDGSATTRLTILQSGPEGLETVAVLPNEQRPEAIGKPGESLYAARFIGDRAYLVTFLFTDPLYVIDLSNPADPFIAGELEISGYSDYLHVLEPGLLLGVGKEAIEVGEPDAMPGAWEQGVKLSLFDVSNPAAPLELDAVEIGLRGTHSDVLWDHLAFTWLPRADGSHRIAIPVRLHEQPATMDPKPAWYWHGWTHTGLHLFEVAGGRITPAGEIVVEGAGSISERWVQDPDRSLLRGDEVHYLRGGSVWSAEWTAPELAIGPQ